MATELRSEELRTLFSSAGQNKLLLPNFQRDFVWSLEDQKGLATSLLLQVPIGSLLFLTGTTGDFSSRPMGMQLKVDLETDSECEFVLDGQQRLSTLYSAIADPFGKPNWEEAVRATFWNLRYRWALRIVPDQNEADLFGFSDLIFRDLPSEPESIRTRFEPKRVNLTQSTGASNWYHPAWRFSESENTRKLSVINASAKEGLVPLWTISSDIGPESLHVQVLRKVAQTRVEVLKAQLRDGNASADLRKALERIGDIKLDEADVERYVDTLSDLRADWVQSMTTLLSSMATFRVPLVELPVSQVDRAIVIFESMNRGGMPLSTFDLLTARLARTEESQNLSELLFKRISSFELVVPDQLWGTTPGTRPATWAPALGTVGLAKDAPSVVFKNTFLSMLSMLSALESNSDLTVLTTKQTAVLALTPEQVQKHWLPATDAILRAWAFLQMRCGVGTEGDLRNRLLVLPIALALRAEDSLNNKQLVDRLEYWYWCSVLTSTYAERQNENAVEDANKLLKWATGNKEENPFALRQSKALKDPGYSDKAVLLRTEENAGVATDVGIYLLQYELSLAPYDLLSVDKRLHAWETLTEDHHLVPLGSAKTVFESTREIRRSREGIGRLLNSPLNRSLISSEANRRIGSMQIQQYLSSVPENARIARGIPALDTLSEAGATEDVAKTLMANRYQWFVDKVQSELDSLLG